MNRPVKSSNMATSFEGTWPLLIAPHLTPLQLEGVDVLMI
jgi:hypothetical protein